MIEIDALRVSLLSKISSLKDTKDGHYMFKAENWNKLLLVCAVSDTYVISRVFWHVLDVGRSKQLNLVP